MRLAAVAGLALLAGCGSRETATVRVSLETARSPVYIEGFKWYAGLAPDAPALVDGDSVVFERRPGRYALTSYVRPCDGNCGLLDPPTGRCSGTVAIPGDAAVAVLVTPGSPCRIVRRG